MLNTTLPGPFADHTIYWVGPVLGALLAEWLDGFPGIGSLMITANADQEVQLLMAACLTAVLLSLVAYALVEVSTIWAARRGYRVDEMAIGLRR